MLAAAIVAAALAAGTPSGAAVSPGDAVRAELRDQHGIPRSLADERGHPTVALVVTARRLRTLKAWEVELRARTPGLHYVRVCDVPPAPPTTWERVAARLRGRVPAEVPVLVDVERVWARAFALDTEEVNALVFDARGSLVARARGPRSDAALRAVTDAAAPLLRARGETARRGEGAR
jgi:hypothetical protein